MLGKIKEKRNKTSTIKTFIFYSITASGSSTDKPMYVQVFATHQHWEGTYLYNSSINYCYMFVHSEHYLKKDLILATFRDRHGTTVELEGKTLKVKYMGPVVHNLRHCILNN